MLEYLRPLPPRTGFPFSLNDPVLVQKASYTIVTNLRSSSTRQQNASGASPAKYTELWKKTSDFNGSEGMTMKKKEMRRLCCRGYQRLDHSGEPQHRCRFAPTGSNMFPDNVWTSQLTTPRAHEFYRAQWACDVFPSYLPSILAPSVLCDLGCSLAMLQAP